MNIGNRSIKVVKMTTDMTRDFFAEYAYGKAALIKMGDVCENFRLYCCSWLDDERTVMEVTGAEFRKAKRGKFKGILSIIVPGTKKTVFVAKAEIDAAR